MRPALSRRVAAAFAAGFPTLDQRARVIAALEQPGVATFGDLPAEIRDLVLRLEGDTGTTARPGAMPGRPQKGSR